MSKTSNSEKYIAELNKPTPEQEMEFFKNIKEIEKVNKDFQNSLLDKPRPL